MTNRLERLKEMLSRIRLAQGTRPGDKLAKELDADANALKWALDQIEALEQLERAYEELQQRNRAVVATAHRIRRKADEAVGAAGNDDAHRQSGAEGAVDYLIQQYSKAKNGQ